MITNQFKLCKRVRVYRAKQLGFDIADWYHRTKSIVFTRINAYR